MLTPEQIEWLHRNKAMSGASDSAPATSSPAAGVPQSGVPHTMFQFAGRSAAPGGPTVSPFGKPTAASRLDELAKYPREAHRAWKRLSAAEQTTVTNKMAAIFDKKFADEFAAVAKSGKPDFTTIYWQPGTALTPDKLKAAGWRFLGREITGNAGIASRSRSGCLRPARPDGVTSPPNSSCPSSRPNRRRPHAPTATRLSC